MKAESERRAKKIEALEKIAAERDLTKEENEEWEKLRTEASARGKISRFFSLNSAEANAKAKAEVEAKAEAKARAEAAKNLPTPPAEKKVEEKKAEGEKPGWEFSYKNSAGQENKFPARVKKDDVSVRVDMLSALGLYVFEGTAIGGKYAGDWKSPSGKNRGKFKVEFPEGKCGEGWHHDDDHPAEGDVKFFLCQK